MTAITPIEEAVARLRFLANPVNSYVQNDALVQVPVGDIRALLASMPNATGWRPIETLDWKGLADGEEMLIANDRGIFVGAWEADWSREHGFHGGWWMISDGKDPERALRGDIPTHWQPLPAPPGDLESHHD